MIRHYLLSGSANPDWLAAYDAMAADDPFTLPAPKGQPPYWLREPADSTMEKHRRMLAAREIAHASRD